WSYMFPSSSDKVNLALYESYAVDDLRKKLWYFEDVEGVSYRGSYGGDFYMFCGLAVDEMHLTKSECLVRLGRVEEGITTLNSYLQTRFEVNKYEPLIITSGDEALKHILSERRKALAFRG